MYSDSTPGNLSKGNYHKEERYLLTPDGSVIYDCEAHISQLKVGTHTLIPSTCRQVGRIVPEDWDQGLIMTELRTEIMGMCISRGTLGISLTVVSLVPSRVPGTL